MLRILGMDFRGWSAFHSRLLTQRRTSRSIDIDMIRILGTVWIFGALFVKDFRHGIDFKCFAAIFRRRCGFLRTVCISGDGAGF